VHFETTVGIAAPRDKVWGTLVDVSHWPDWTDSVRQATWLDDTGMAPGGRVRIKQPGMPALVWEVSELEPGVSFSWRSVSPGITTLGTHALQETGDARVTVTLGLHQSGALAPIIGLFTAARSRRYVQMEADGLKKSSEAKV
jgi:uncharacterized membrane protein